MPFEKSAGAGESEAAVQTAVVASSTPASLSLRLKSQHEPCRESNDESGNLEKAYQTLELWLQTYPRGEEPPGPLDLLAGLATHGTGRFERAIEASVKKIAADPNFVFAYQNLASSYLFLDRFEEAGAR